MAGRPTAFVSFALALCFAATVVAANSPTIQYLGRCDGSAGVAVEDRWLVTASDEENELAVYDLARGGAALREVDLSGKLELEEDEESDIEAASWLGDRIYWITSHGRNTKGKPRAARRRLFAVRATPHADAVEIEFVGRASSDLLASLLADPALSSLGLQAAVGDLTQAVPELAPERDGISIEGLASAADGRSLLIGFRNPRPGGRALVVALLNPTEVVDRGASARFGEPMLLATDGLGVRAMAYSVFLHRYFLIAGPVAEGAPLPRLWSGDPSDAPTSLPASLTGDLNVEAAVPLEGGRRILLLSDDGTDACKKTQAAMKSFRGRIVEPRRNQP